MKNYRKKLEEIFYTVAGLIYDHRIKVLGFMLALTAVLFTQLSKLEIDTSTEGFFFEDDKPMVDYNAFREQFGRDEMVVIALEPETVFDLEFLATLKAIHQDLKAHVPHLNDITSLVNVRFTEGRGDELVVDDLEKLWPESDTEMAAFKTRVMTNKLYRNTIVSEDAGFTTILLESNRDSMAGGISDGDDFGEMGDTETVTSGYLTDQENSEFVEAIETIVAKYRDKGLTIHVAGSPLVTHYLKVIVGGETQLFMDLSILCLSVFLLLMFRRVSGVVLPILIVIVSLVATVAAMAASGVPLTLATQILPSFLIIVGVGDAVHILAVFYYRYNTTGDKRGSVLYSVSHSGLAILMTSITTAGGLMSFSFARIAPISHLGIFGAIGVMIAFVYTITLLPALLSLIPLKQKQRPEQKRSALSVDRLLEGISRLTTEKPVAVLLVSILITGVFAAGIPGVRFSHNVLKWLPESNSLRVSTEKIDDAMNGTISMEVVLDTGRENGLYSPDFLKRLDEAGNHIETFTSKGISIGKTLSVANIVRETNQALHENRAEHYSIPEDKELIAQELMLFENSGSDDLEDSVDSLFSKARLTIKAPFEDSVLYVDIIRDIEIYLKTVFPDAEVMLTGTMPLFINIIGNTLQSFISSYIFVIIIVSVLMMLLIGKPGIGLVSMVPNLFPVVMVLGIMGWFDIPIDFSTATIGSIVIGIAVDDTIHFFHNFRRYYEETGSTSVAIYNTLNTAGRAMLTTTVVLSLGFYIFMASSVNNLFNFGLLTGTAILGALAADFFMAPALLVLINRKEELAGEYSMVTG